MATIKKACKGALYPKSSSVSKRLGSPSKAKNGKSFPDLNKDGKVTQKDVLIGRGVLPKTAKKGTNLKKQAATAIAMKKAGKAPKKAMMGASTMQSPMMKKGGKMKKCKYGCK